MCVMSRLLMTAGFRACSKLPKNMELDTTEHGIQGTVNASAAFLLPSVVPVVPLGTELYLAPVFLDVIK